MGLFNDDINVIFTGSGERGPPGIGFALTSNGDFDIKKKRLTDVGSPTEASDSTTKEYVNLNKICIEEFIRKMNSYSLLEILIRVIRCQ